MSYIVPSHCRHVFRGGASSKFNRHSVRTLSGVCGPCPFYHAGALPVSRSSVPCSTRIYPSHPTKLLSPSRKRCSPIPRSIPNTRKLKIRALDDPHLPCNPRQGRLSAVVLASGYPPRHRRRIENRARPREQQLRPRLRPTRRVLQRGFRRYVTVYGAPSLCFSAGSQSESGGGVGIWLKPYTHPERALLRSPSLDCT